MDSSNWNAIHFGLKYRMDYRNCASNYGNNGISHLQRAYEPNTIIGAVIAFSGLLVLISKGDLNIDKFYFKLWRSISSRQCFYLEYLLFLWKKGNTKLSSFFNYSLFVYNYVYSSYSCYNFR